MLAYTLNSNGNKTAFTYADINGDYIHDELVSVTDPQNRVSTYAYGNVAMVGQLEIFRLQNITDYAGRITSFKYHVDPNELQPLGYLSEIEGPWILDENGVQKRPKTKYEYTQAGKIASITDPRMNVAEYTYDSFDRLTAHIDFDGSVHRYSPSVVQVLGPEAVSTDDLMAIEVDKRGYEQSKILNQFGNVVEHHDGLGNIRTTLRDFRGVVTGFSEDVEVDGTVSTVATTYRYKDEPDGSPGFVKDQTTFSDDTDVVTVEITEFSDSMLPEVIVDEIGREFHIEYDGNTSMVLSERLVVGDFDVGEIEDDVVYGYTYTPPPTLPTDLPGGLLRFATDPLGRLTEYVYHDEAADPATFGRLKQGDPPDVGRG